MDATVAAEGRIDVVVHTAAVMAYGTIEDLPAATFDQVVRHDHPRHRQHRPGRPCPSSGPSSTDL